MLDENSNLYLGPTEKKYNMIENIEVNRRDLGEITESGITTMENTEKSKECGEDGGYG